MKKLLAFVAAVFAGFMFMPNVFAAEGPELVTIESKEMFFAKGVAITIEARTDEQPGAIIKWDGGEKTVGAQAYIFGGDHATDEVIAKTSITMNGGTVRNIFGGGLHKSNVTETNIVVNGGKVTSVTGGGASSLVTECGHSFYAGDKAGAVTLVGTANVTINDGDIWGVFGGSEGIGYTNTANVTIKGGEIDYVIAGGSNGFTDLATVTVEGGKIATLQSVNRGEMEESDITVTGGEVTNAYVGGDSSDATVDGVIGDATMTITGGTVTNALVGTTGGVTAKDVADLTYVKGTVTNIDETTFQEGLVEESVVFTLNCQGEEEVVLIPVGTVFEDADMDELKASIEEALKDTGYAFDGFYADEEYETKFDNSKAIEEATTLYIKVVQKREDELVDIPNTADINLIALLATAVVGATGFAFAMKNRKFN